MGRVHVVQVLELSTNIKPYMHLDTTGGRAASLCWSPQGRQ